MLTRRTMLAVGATGLAAASFGPKFAFAQAASDKRLLVLVMRGAVDGLALAAPLGDPAFRQHRGQWLESYEGAHKLDSMFSLHPRLGEIGKLYAEGDALVAHAVATDYRERSHFDAQNMLETGGTKPFVMRDGFLNRLLGLMNGRDNSAVALASALPLALRGKNPASTYAPSTLPQASEGLIERLPDLYAEDQQLAALLQQAQLTEDIADASGMRNINRAKDAGTLAARMLSDPQGARIAMLDLPGWDSHAGQLRMLDKGFRQLDILMSAFRTGMGEVWDNTLVLAVTEFGRTVAINGTFGTDHGTATSALLMGGAVRGGRVISDWPGLAQNQLFQGRDLKPTMSLEALVAGALGEHFALDSAQVMRELFPDRNARPVEQIIA